VDALINLSLSDSANNLSLVNISRKTDAFVTTSRIKIELKSFLKSDIFFHGLCYYLLNTLKLEEEGEDKVGQ
jgi:hypothetical protein